MKLTRMYFLLLLIVLGVAGVKAQTYIVTVGDQVTAAADVEDNGLYALYNPRNGYCMYEDSSNKLLLYGGLSLDGLNGSTTTNAVFRLIDNGDGTYKVQNYDSNRYLPAPTGNGNISTSETAGSYALNIQSDGNMFPRCTNNGTTYGLDHTSAGVYAFTNLNMNNGSAQNYQLYKITLSEYVEPEGVSVITLNNTNTSRGALIYNPSASEKWVWSSGKSGTFSPTDANSQWVLYPTGDAMEYYLYNLGAKKFAVPTTGGTFGGYSWMFSHDAVALTLSEQTDGTYKIYTSHGGLCLSVSNNYVGPIISYDDIGAKFTMTALAQLTDEQEQELKAAIGNLVHQTTPLTAAPSGDGWYALRIKTHDKYPDYFVFTPEEEINYNGTNYALNFYHAAKVRPAIDNPTYYFRLAQDGTGYDWQMPNGRYLYKNNSNKFPVSTETATAISVDYSANGFRFSHNAWYGVPYLLGGVYFIGETSNSGNTYYDVYPIDLTAAGLTAWQMVCANAPETQLISCSRSDVSGQTSVYKNGYIFLPGSVTPANTDFALDGATDVVVDATNHTVTFTYNPNIAIVENGVTVEQGWQTVGRGGEVMLLRVTAQPFKDATGTTLTVSLKDGSEDNVSSLTLYEAGSSSPEIYSTGSGAPTKTVIATANITGSTAIFDIGNFTAGTHYYWIGATAKADAVLGDVIDAAVTGITYMCNNNETTLDLTSIGDPSDRGAMVFNAHSYPFLPRDNGSRVYRIPAMVVADDGSIIVAADKRYESHTDIGGGHVIDIVVRRSTDGGKTWSSPVTIAKGDNSNSNTCGYGDPSLIKGKDGKLYCFFAAGNIGYFYGLNRICMSVSEDNGVTWNTSADNPPADLVSTGRVTDHAVQYGNNTCYGLYDYFVTSGRGLYTSEGYLMALMPAQAYTDQEKTGHTSNSQDYIFYSTDQGATWHFSEQAIFAGGDEAKVIQANDGSLLGSIRQGYNRGFNTATYTKNADGTLTFTMGTQWNNSQLNAGGYANNQDILYYQRETETGKTDVIFHSMTTGQHANFKLYYSTDQGVNWTEFLNVQTKGTRYVTMERSGSEENPGSLYLFFEDQSLNSAGGSTDYNHYPLNFLEITREQLESLIPTLNDYAVPDFLDSKDVKIVYGSNVETTYGSWNGLTWTSNAASGKEEVTMTLSDGIHDKFSNLNGYYNLAYHPAAANSSSTLTLTAPEGYVITGYSVQTGVYQAETYTLTTEDGTTITPANLGSEYTPLNVTGLNTTSTTITITTTDATKWLALANFTVKLAKPLALNVVGDKSYATLYLPFDVETDAATKAYYILNVANDIAELTEVSDGSIPAFTAVVLVNDKAATQTTLEVTSDLDPIVSEEENLLKGTLVPKSLDLSNDTRYYSLGRLNGNIGFYKFMSNGSSVITLGANKAYLEIPVPTGNQVKGFRIVFGNDAIVSDDGGLVDGINEVQATGKDEVFNLNGMRVSTPRKGIYIVNGKKIVK